LVSYLRFNTFPRTQPIARFRRKVLNSRSHFYIRVPVLVEAQPQKRMISSILLAHLLLMYGNVLLRYKSSTLYYFCQQHYFDFTTRRDPRHLPSHKCNFEGSARRILHSKNKLHANDRVQKRVNITVKAFLFAKNMFFMFKLIFFQNLTKIHRSMKHKMMKKFKVRSCWESERCYDHWV